MRTRTSRWSARPPTDSRRWPLQTSSDRMCACSTSGCPNSTESRPPVASPDPDVEDPLAVVVITTFDLDEYVHGALKAGARGFLLKDAGPELLVQAMQAAAARETH